MKCAASWLGESGTSDEAKAAIQTILNESESWPSFVVPLTLEYWHSRSEVWLILEVLDRRTSTAVRQLAFDGLLDHDPRRFIASAIEETQDLRQVKAEVLKALAEIAKKKGAAIAASVRRSVTPSNRPRVLRLLRDFSASDAPLKTVADDLWLTRFWLSIQQFFSGSNA